MHGSSSWTLGTVNRHGEGGGQRLFHERWGHLPALLPFSYFPPESSLIGGWKAQFWSFISLLVMCPLHSGESPHLHCGWWCPWGLPLLATSASWRKLSRLEWHQLISFKIRLSSSHPQGLSKCFSFCCLEHNSHPSSSSYASVGKTLPWVILLCCCRLPSNTLMTHLNFLFERNYSYFGY